MKDPFKERKVPKRSKFKIKFAFAWGLSEGGYYQVPLLYFAWGRNGIIVTVLALQVTVGWNLKWFEDE